MFISDLIDFAYKMVGGAGGDREDAAIGGRIHREYRGGGRGSGRYRRGLSHHRPLPPGERRSVVEQGLLPEEESQKVHTDKVDLIKHRPHKGKEIKHFHFIRLFAYLSIIMRAFREGFLKSSSKAKSLLSTLFIKEEAVYVSPSSMGSISLVVRCSIHPAPSARVVHSG